MPSHTATTAIIAAWWHTQVAFGDRGIAAHIENASDVRIVTRDRVLAFGPVFSQDTNPTVGIADLSAHVAIDAPDGCVAIATTGFVFWKAGRLFNAAILAVLFVPTARGAAGRAILLANTIIEAVLYDVAVTPPDLVELAAGATVPVERCEMNTFGCQRCAVDLVEHAALAPLHSVVDAASFSAHVRTGVFGDVAVQDGSDPVVDGVEADEVVDIDAAFVAEGFNGQNNGVAVVIDVDEPTSRIAETDALLTAAVNDDLVVSDRCDINGGKPAPNGVGIVSIAVSAGLNGFSDP